MKLNIPKISYISWYKVFIVGYLADRLFTRIGVALLGVDLEGNEYLKQLFINNDILGAIVYELVSLAVIMFFAFAMNFNEHEMFPLMLTGKSKLRKLHAFILSVGLTVIPIYLAYLLLLMGTGWFLTIVFNWTTAIPLIWGKMICIIVFILVWIIWASNMLIKGKEAVKKEKEENKSKCL